MISERDQRFRTLTVLFFVVAALYGLVFGLGFWATSSAIRSQTGAPPSPAEYAVISALMLVWLGFVGAIGTGLIRKRLWAALVVAVVSAIAMVAGGINLLRDLPKLGENADFFYKAGYFGVLSIAFSLVLTLFITSIRAARGRHAVTQPPQFVVQPPIPPAGSNYPVPLAYPTIYPEAPPLPIEVQGSSKTIGIVAIVCFCLLVLAGTGLGYYGIKHAQKDPTSWTAIPKWTDHHNAELEFTASFPAEPKVTRFNKEVGEFSIAITAFGVSSRSSSVSVIASPYPEEALINLRNPHFRHHFFGPEIIHESWLAAQSEGLELLNYEDITFYGSYARRGKVYDKVAKLHGELMIVHAGTIEYMVMAFANDQNIISHFLDSFRITGEPGYKLVDTLNIVEDGSWKVHPEDESDAALIVIDGKAPYSWRFDSKAVGVTADITGDKMTLHHEQTRTGKYNIDGRAWDARGASVGFRYTLSVSEAHKLKQTIIDEARLSALVDSLSYELPNAHIGLEYEHSIEDELFREVVCTVSRIPSWMTVSHRGSKVVFSGVPVVTRRVFNFDMYLKFNGLTASKSFKLSVTHRPGARFGKSSRAADVVVGLPFHLKLEIVTASARGHVKMWIDETAPEWVRVVNYNGQPALGGIAEKHEGAAVFAVWVTDNAQATSEMVVTLNTIQVVVPEVNSDGAIVLPRIPVYWDTHIPLFEFKNLDVARLVVIDGALPKNMYLRDGRTGFRSKYWYATGSAEEVGEFSFTLEATLKWGEKVAQKYVLSSDRSIGDPFVKNLHDRKSNNNIYLAIGRYIGGAVGRQVKHLFNEHSVDKFNWQHVGISETAKFSEAVVVNDTNSKSILSNISALPTRLTPSKNRFVNVAELVDWENVQDNAHVIFAIGDRNGLKVLNGVGDWAKVKKLIKEKNITVAIVYYRSGSSNSNDFVGALARLTGGYITVKRL